MNIRRNDPPREFGTGHSINLHDCGQVDLDENEQVTFTTKHGAEWDVIRKAWGFYATPSLNGRLADHGLRAALVLNQANKLFLLLCEKGREEEFESYLAGESSRLLSWLDSDEAVNHVAALLNGKTQEAEK
jgi:hypothetical protein